MKAKEYYYEYIAPEEGGKSYQELQAIDMKSRFGYVSADSVGKNFTPRYSNDFLLDYLIEDFARNADASLQNRLENIFVAKRFNKVPNARAKGSKKDYEGDLIFFQVGLSDACFQYAILLSNFQYMKAYLKDYGINHPKSLEQVSVFQDKLIKLSNAQKRWSSYWDFIQIEKDFNLIEGSQSEQEERAAEIALLTDRFILGHEIAHHLLGHTGNYDIGKGYIELLPDNCKLWHKSDSVHAKEFQADALSLLMTCNATKELSNHQDRENPKTGSALGALLTLTVLGQLAGDIHKPTRTHPKVAVSYKQAMHILVELTYHGFLIHIFEDFLSFHKLLHTTQNRGFTGDIDDLFKD